METKIVSVVKRDGRIVAFDAEKSLSQSLNR